MAKLAELVTAWAVTSRCVLGREHSFNGVTRYHHIDPRYADRPSTQSVDHVTDFEDGPGRTGGSVGTAGLLGLD